MAHPGSARGPKIFVLNRHYGIGIGSKLIPPLPGCGERVSQRRETGVRHGSERRPRYADIAPGEFHGRLQAGDTVYLAQETAEGDELLLERARFLVATLSRQLEQPHAWPRHHAGERENAARDAHAQRRVERGARTGKDRKRRRCFGRPIRNLRDSPPDSFIPTMLGCVASRETAAGNRFTPVTAVKLYRRTGTGEASATAL